MIVTQISVFMENRPGRLKYVLGILSDAGVNLQALSLADSVDFGIARILVGDTEAALKAIREAGLTSTTTRVAQREIPHTPGGLANNIIAPLAEADVNIEYIYAYSEGVSGKAMVVMKVDDLEKAAQVLG